MQRIIKKEEEFCTQPLCIVSMLFYTIMKIEVLSIAIHSRKEIRDFRIFHTLKNGFGSLLVHYVDKYMLRKFVCCYMQNSGSGTLWKIPKSDAKITTQAISIFL